MADPQHLDILRRGPESWNRWRKGNSDIRPDFRGADLGGANLNNTFLNDADFTRANLMGASLVQAYLSDANLTWANLRQANLARAGLRRTNLSGADLTGATLRETSLHETIFAGVDLTHTSGLDSCNHTGPSTLDFRTLVWSGQLPLPFLRGCGLPEQFIAYLPALLSRAIEFQSCFISYSTKDQEFAARLQADLQNNGVRCWFAPKDIQGGKKVHEQINAAIQSHDRLLLVLSEASMNSEWVKSEIRKARKREAQEKRRMLFPLRLVAFESLRTWECYDADLGTDLACEIREYYVPDFSNWSDHDFYQQEFGRLLQDLRSQGQRAPSTM